MGIRNFPVISTADDTGFLEEDISTTAAKIAIPTMANGALPKYLYIQCASGSTSNVVSVMPTQDAVGDINKGVVILPNRDPVILMVHGYTHIGTDSSGNATSDLWLTPLEDF